MAPKGAPTVAGTSQNWAQNASQNTQNPVHKCTIQPDLHTGNAKIAYLTAVKNQMKIWIIKSHVFRFPVCVSGSNGRPRRPKNTENWSKNNNKLFKNRVGSTARPSGRVGRQSYARFKAEIALDNIPTFLGRVKKAYAFKFMVLCLVAHDMRAHRSWEPSVPFCSLKKRSARGFPESQNFTFLLSMVEWDIAMARILSAMVELVS